MNVIGTTRYYCQNVCIRTAQRTNRLIQAMPRYGRARGPDGTDSSDEVFFFSTFGRRNGFCLTSFVTLPLRMHWVQTSLVALAPLGRVTRSRCKFGLNFRRVIPVIFVPTPPRYFCLPRMVTEFPIEAPFPQTSQQRAITPPFSYKNHALNDAP